MGNFLIHTLFNRTYTLEWSTIEHITSLNLWLSLRQFMVIENNI